ncbi:MAG: HAD family phosphatase, partial [Cypionkella sp.]|nr:HAD family phosphatase [Cypionkella sp.]
AISQAVERQGARMPRDWYLGLTGLGRSDLFAAYVRDFGTPLNLSRAIEESISLTISLAAKARENRAVATIAREASGRLPIAVVTNSETAVASALLHAAGLLSLFDALLGCESAPRPKPAPDLYLAAAARLGCSPADCLVFEDSNQGILAASAADMRCIDVRDHDWQRLYKAQHRCPLSATLGRTREVR